MLMPQSDRKKIYEFFFEQGVVVVSKDFLKTHPEIKDVKNLHVIKAMKGLCSSGFAVETFAWRHHYFQLNDGGLIFLREYLSLGEDVVPLSHKTHRTDPRQAVFIEKPTRGFGKMELDRDGYRTGDGEKEKATEAGPGANAF